MNASQMKDMAAFAVKRATKKKGTTFGGINALVSKMNANVAGHKGGHQNKPTQPNTKVAEGNFKNGAPDNLGRPGGHAPAGGSFANGAPGSLGRGTDTKKVKGPFNNGAPSPLGKKR